MIISYEKVLNYYDQLKLVEKNMNYKNLDNILLKRNLKIKLYFSMFIMFLNIDVVFLFLFFCPDLITLSSFLKNTLLFKQKKNNNVSN